MMRTARIMKRNKIKQRPGDIVFDVFNVCFMAFLMIIMIYPLWYVLIASISDPLLIMQHRGLLFWIKGNVSLRAYEEVFKNPFLLSGYRNTLFYVLVGTTVNVVMTALAAYVLSRKQFMLRRPISLMITFTMFFSGGMIPTFLCIKNLGLYDTPWAIIFPSAISVYNFVVMRTNIEALPVSLEESARLDGAGDIKILFRIVLPLSMPIVAVMILFYGVARWNSWFDAMIYLQNRDKYPLQLVLREVLIGATQQQLMSDVTDDSVRPGLEQLIKYATVIVATLPILCVYPFLQKYFVQGMMVGAVKE